MIDCRIFQEKKEGELRRLKCFVHALIDIYMGFTKHLSKKNTPVLEDEGGLNVFTTE